MVQFPIRLPSTGLRLTVSLNLPHLVQPWAALATVLPKSMEYANSWEVATNIREKSLKRYPKEVHSRTIPPHGSDPSSTPKFKTRLFRRERCWACHTWFRFRLNDGKHRFGNLLPTDQLVPIITLPHKGLRMVAPIHKTYLSRFWQYRNRWYKHCSTSLIGFFNGCNLWTNSSSGLNPQKILMIKKP